MAFDRGYDSDPAIKHKQIEKHHEVFSSSLFFNHRFRRYGKFDNLGNMVLPPGFADGSSR